MIPKRIITCWIGGHKSDLIERCIDSQKRCAEEFGYEYFIIDNTNFYKGSQYVNDAFSAKRWTKASDMLRVYEVYKNGGIYLDADMEVLAGKNFNHLIDNRMFIPMEECGHYGNAGFGAEPGNPILKKYIDTIERNFKGDGELVYEPGVRGFTDIFWDEQGSEEYKKTRFLTQDYFFPWVWQTNIEHITENTLVKHWYNSRTTGGWK